LTEKSARNAIAENQPLSVTDAEKYFARSAGFLKYGLMVAAMVIQKLFAKPAIMIRKSIFGEIMIKEYCSEPKLQILTGMVFNHPRLNEP